MSSFNVHGLFSRISGSRFCKLDNPDFVNLLCSDIVCLIETKHGADDYNKLVLPGYSLVKAEHRQRLSKGIYGGLAVFAKVELKKAISILNSDADHIWIKINKSFVNCAQDLFICFVYIPPKDSNYVTRKGNSPSVFEVIENDLVQYGEDNCFIMGDFNSHIKDSDFDFIADDMSLIDILPSAYPYDIVHNYRHSVKPCAVTDSFGNQLLDLCIASQMRILNGRSLGDTYGKCTSYQWNGSAIVDYCLASANMLKYVNYFKVDPLSIYSDHAQISVNLDMAYSNPPLQSLNRSLPKSFIWSADSSLAYGLTMNSLPVEHQLQAFIDKLNISENNDVCTATSEITNIFINVAKVSGIKSATMIRKGKRKKKKKDKPWFDKVCRSLRKTLKSLANKLSNNPFNKTVQQSYFKHKKEYKCLIRKKNRQYKAELLNNLLNIEDNNPSQFWKIVDKLKNDEGSWSDRSNNISPEEWTDYFHKLLNNDTKTDMPDSEHMDYSTCMVNDKDLTTPFTCSEISKCIHSLKKNTSAGLDSINNGMIKCSSPSMIKCLCILFNKIMDCGTYPKSWRENMIKALFKSGNDLDPNNYRGISLSSCLSKLFAKLVHLRLDNFVETNNILKENQIGFRKKYRTSDHILTLKNIVDRAFRSNKYIFVCFVDLKKAFDSINREALFYKISKMGITSKYLNLLNSIYSDVQYSVKLSTGITESFASNVGVKQGCILSPLLFNLFMNDLPDTIQDFDPVQLGNSDTNVLMYADDLILMSESKEGLQSCLNNLNVYCSKWNLKVNIDKTQIMVFNKSGRLLLKNKFYFGSNELKLTQEYKYLGILMKPSGVFSHSVKQLSNKALKVVFMIRRKFNFDKINAKLMFKLFDTCVVPVLLYGCEVWLPYILNLDKLSNSTEFSLESKYKNFIPDKIHTRYCKYVLGVGKYASDIASLAELGRFPVAINALHHYVKYWLTINDISKIDYEKRFVFQSLVDVNDNISTYNANMKSFLCKINFAHVWENKTSFSSKSLAAALQTKLRNRYTDYFKLCINDPNSKLRTYCLFKTSYTMEMYLLLNLNKDLLKQFARFRISNHSLEIETGRFATKKEGKYSNTPVENRLCKLCGTSVEDEKHFLIQCSAYLQPRHQFYSDIIEMCPAFEFYSDNNKFTFLLGSTDYEILNLLVKYVCLCFGIRIKALAN